MPVMTQQKFGCQLRGSMSFAVLAGTKSSKNLPVTEVSSSHNECKQGANLLSKKMPSYTVTLETRTLHRQKKELRNHWLQAWHKITGEAERVVAVLDLVTSPTQIAHWALIARCSSHTVAVWVALRQAAFWAAGRCELTAAVWC